MCLHIEACEPTPSMNTILPTLLRVRAEEVPDRRYLIDIEDRELSYAATVGQMDLWAAAYARQGVQAGEHVVTMQHNTIESFLGWLGLTCLGAVEAPINTDYRGQLLAHALNITRAKTIVLLEQFVDRLVEIATELRYLQRVIVIDAKRPVLGLPFETLTGGAFLKQPLHAPSLREPRPSDIAAVLFTSGTTGPSKAVQMPWAQIYATASGTFPLQDFGPHDVIFNPGPTYHVGAKVFPFIAALAGGSHVMRPFISLSRQPDEYRKYGVTTCFYPPFAWLDEPERPDDADCALHNILMPLLLPRIDEFKKRFGCRTFAAYSMTEISCPIAFPDWNAERLSEEGLFSCGKARRGYPGYELCIVDENDQPLGPGDVGELVVRTTDPWTINAGYLNNPDATTEAWRNGWFHTGDAFSCDQDGNYYFRDRLKDCIRRRGENISSFEVEFLVRKHPDVLECAAVAVALGASAGSDEEIRLFVVPKPGAELDAGDLIRWLIPRMPRFMVPRFVEFTTALPQTPTLKVQKALLRSRPLDADVWDRERAGIELPR
jgi:carnitine-CoA ligase